MREDLSKKMEAHRRAKAQAEAEDAESYGRSKERRDAQWAKWCIKKCDKARADKQAAAERKKACSL
jgi:hypothetical protein